MAAPDIPIPRLKRAGAALLGIVATLAGCGRVLGIDDVAPWDASASPDLDSGHDAPDGPATVDMTDGDARNPATPPDAKPPLDAEGGGTDAMPNTNVSADASKDAMDDGLDVRAEREAGDSSFVQDSPEELLGGPVDAAIGPPRLIRPLSTSMTTSQRPTLRWALAPGNDGARVQVCRDRMCTRSMMMADVSGATWTPNLFLPKGTYFWRAWGRSGGATGSTPSTTWMFTTGARSTAVDTVWGTTLDVNGDGRPDLAVGAPTIDSNTGRVYLYEGGSAAFSTVPKTTMSGPAGARSEFGRSVACAGDVNGDGFADLVVGAPAFANGFGQAYVYMGGPTGLPSQPSITLPYTQGVLQFGTSVASAGDVNGDGYADIVIGSTSVGLTGRAFVYFGGPSGPATTPSAMLDGSLQSDDFSFAVASAGDVNGDGYGDLVVGGPVADNRTGAAYVFLGSASGVANPPFLVLHGSGGIGSRFGQAVASAGDVNSDGYTDIVVGAPGTEGSTSGRAFLYLGAATAMSTSAVVTLYATGTADHFGVAVASAGDINGDGYSDIVVGADTAPSWGDAYVFRGTIDPSSIMQGSSFSGNPSGFKRFGQAAAGVGDMDGDGYDDFVIGAPSADNDNGRVFFFRGSLDGVPARGDNVQGPDPLGHFGASLDSVR